MTFQVSQLDLGPPGGLATIPWVLDFKIPDGSVRGLKGGPFMKLYLVHCGFYDNEICDGLYESHANFFVAAESFEDARAQAKRLPEFQTKRMHVDGLQEIQAVSGFKIHLEHDASLEAKTHIVNFKHRELASKPTATSDGPA